MSIKNYKIKPMRFLFLVHLFVFSQCYSQEISGVYVLDSNHGTYYAHFKANSYNLFSVENELTSGGLGSNIIKEAGTGTYKKTNKSFSLSFDSVRQNYLLYSLDSLVCSMYSKNSTTGRTFDII